MFDTEFGDTDFGEWKDQVERLEQELARLEGLVARIRARQTDILTQLDVLQVDLTDGDRGMEDWTSHHLDVSPQVAHRLMVIARQPDSPWLEQMRQGKLGLDRAVFLIKLEQTGAPRDLVEQAVTEYSLGQLWGLVLKHREISAQDEGASFDSRYLVIQPSLDQNMFKLWGQLCGTDGDLVDKALRHRADQFPPTPGEYQSRGQHLADALVSVCGDSLTAGSEPGGEGRTVISAEIFIDANLAAASQGEKGVTTGTGLRVGPSTLEEILCDGKVRVIFTDGEQGPIAITHQTETIPSTIRAFVWQRDQSQCAISGCRSRNRLQIHHIKERSQGGNHHPNNLVLLCWFHHHIAIHGYGLRIDPHSSTHRRRLINPRHRRGPPFALPDSQPRFFWGEKTATLTP